MDVDDGYCLKDRGTNPVACLIKLDLEMSRAAAVVAQSVRAFASHAEGWVFESQP